MKRTIKHMLPVLISFFLSMTADAQDTEMATGMRAEGKIYVVIVIAFFVLAVMSIYLFSIDRKVRKLENRQK